MAVSVGGVMVEFDGDASGAAAAMKAVSEKLDELVSKEKNLKAALDAATASGNLSEDAMRALRTAHSEAATAVARLTGKLDEEATAEREAAKAAKAAADAAKAAEKAKVEQAKASEKLAQEAARVSETHGVLGERARKVDEVMGTLQTSVGGVASAFGVQGQAMTDVIGAVADVAKSLGTGGPLLAAVTVAGAAIAALAVQFEKSAERARESYKKLVEEAQAMSDQLAKDLESLAEMKKEKEIEAMTAGLSAEQAATVRMFVDTADAEKALRDFEKRFGLVPANLSNVVSGVQDMTRDLSRVPQEIIFGYTGDPGFNKYADTLVKTYEQLQQKVKATQAAGQAGVQSAGAGAKAESVGTVADDALTARFNALISSLDKNTAAVEIENEFAEAAPSPDRFEVSKEEFEARLAGIDPDEAQRIAEEQVAAIFDPFKTATETIVVGMTDVVTATADDIESMSADFLAAGEAAFDLRDPLEKFGDAIGDAFDQLGGAAGIATAAIEGGAAGVGQAVGGVAGGAVGTAIGGPAGAQVGAALGSLVGGLLGDALDKLIEALGVVTPLFDAVGVVIGSLQPILVVLGGLFVTIADAIIALAPIIIILSRLIGAVLIPFVRLTQLIVLLIPAISLIATVILVWVDALVVGIDYLDDKFFKPLVDGAVNLVNGFIMAYNALIDMIRGIPGFDKFGTKAELVRSAAATLGVDEMINDVAEAAALQAAEGAAAAGATMGGEGAGAGGGAGAGEGTGTEGSWGQELTNVPSGFKAMAAIYSNADSEAGPAGAIPAQTMITLNIENWNSKGDLSRDWNDLKRIARNGFRSNKAASARSFGDEKN